MIRIQLLQLLVQQCLKILRLFQLPYRTFGCKIRFLPVAVSQRFSHDLLALSLVVWISGVDIIHALIDGMTDHGNGAFLIHRLVMKNRQSHRSKPQCRHLNSCLSKLTILHLSPP